MRRAIALVLIVLSLGIGLVLYGAPAQRELVTWHLPQAGSLPSGVAWTETTVYATLFEADALAALDLRTGTLEKIEIGDGPYGIAIKDGFVYVTLALEDKLAVYKPGPSTLHTYALPTPGGWPAQLDSALWNPGAAYFAINQRTAGRLVYFQVNQGQIPDGGTPYQTTSRLAVDASTIHPRSITVQPLTIHVYPIGEVPQAQLTLAKTVRPPFTEWQVGQGRHLEDVSVAPSGRFWMVQGDATLLRFDPSTNLADVYALPLGTKAVSVDASSYGNDIVFLDGGRNAVGELQFHSGKVTVWPIPGAGDLADLVRDAHDRLWFVDREADVVVCLDRGNNTFYFYDVPAGSSPGGLVTGRDGLDIWFVAEQGDYIGKLVAE